MMKFLKAKNKKGFTLMEMLIVIAIIAILVAIAIPTFSASQKRAKYTTDMANVRSWYAEQITNKLSDDAYVLGTGSSAFEDKLKFSTDATITMSPAAPDADTKAEDFTVTYDPDGSATSDTKYPNITFPK